MRSWDSFRIPRLRPHDADSIYRFDCRCEGLNDAGHGQLGWHRLRHHRLQHQHGAQGLGQQTPVQAGNQIQEAFGDPLSRQRFGLADPFGQGP